MRAWVGAGALALCATIGLPAAQAGEPIDTTPSPALGGCRLLAGHISTSTDFLLADSAPVTATAALEEFSEVRNDKVRRLAVEGYGDGDGVALMELGAWCLERFGRRQISGAP